nr:MAG TPA: hypothetical protein [Caudoviricetes sp.]
MSRVRTPDHAPREAPQFQRVAVFFYIISFYTHCRYYHLIPHVSVV